MEWYWHKALGMSKVYPDRGAVDEYEDKDRHATCDACSKLIHQWVTGDDGFILCLACHAQEYVILAPCLRILCLDLVRTI